MICPHCKRALVEAIEKATEIKTKSNCGAKAEITGDHIEITIPDPWEGVEEARRLMEESERKNLHKAVRKIEGSLDDYIEEKTRKMIEENVIETREPWNDRFDEEVE